jgi:hypothetical protein
VFLIARAIAVNVAIMRTFVRIRRLLATHKEIVERLAEMEKKVDERFEVVFDILEQLMELPSEPPKRVTGFVQGRRNRNSESVGGWPGNVRGDVQTSG